MIRLDNVMKPVSLVAGCLLLMLGAVPARAAMDVEWSPTVINPVPNQDGSIPANFNPGFPAPTKGFFPWSQNAVDNLRGALIRPTSDNQNVIFLKGNSGSFWDIATRKRLYNFTVTEMTGASEYTTVWTQSKFIFWGGTGDNDGCVYDPIAKVVDKTITTVNAPTKRTNHTAVWTGSKMIVWGGSALDGTGMVNTGGIYDPAANSWTDLTTTGAPTSRIDAVGAMVGTKAIFWGGSTDAGAEISGGVYNTVTSTWSTMSTTNVPSRRGGASLFSTNSRMLVWGGKDSTTNQELFNGAYYEPATDTWTAVAEPSSIFPARTGYSVVWTGSKMLLWGGWNSASAWCYDGAVYDLATNSWSPMTLTNVPFPRASHYGLWDGENMIVWGGNDGGDRYDEGVYNLASNTWTQPNTTNAPPARYYHTAVWDTVRGKLIVWGGTNGSTSFNNGGIYDPLTNTWEQMPLAGAPGAMAEHTAIWTGQKMILWGTAGGKIYDPATKTWSAMSTVNEPVRTYRHTALWTNSKMIIWGGTTDSFGSGSRRRGVNTGSYYDPSTDQWTKISTVNAPSVRWGQCAAWTGKEMMVYGGYDYNSGYSGFTDGAIWTFSSNTWSSMTSGDRTTGGEAVWTGSNKQQFIAFPIKKRYDTFSKQWFAISSTITGSGPMNYTGPDGYAIFCWGNGGGIYDTLTDTWASITGTGAPASRSGHTATWTGSSGMLIVWGGGRQDGGILIKKRPKIKLTAATTTVNEAAGSISVTVTASGVTAGTSASVVCRTATTNSAVAGQDYTFTSRTLSITANGTQTFTVPIIDDKVTEPSETFSIELVPNDNVTLDTSSSARITIIDDDLPGAIRVDKTGYSVTESEPNVTVTVKRNGTADGATVNYETADGTAVDGLDYTAVSGTIVFGPDETSKTVVIPILNDRLVEGNENFTFLLSSPAGGATLDTPNQANVTIVDDDFHGKLRFDKAASTVNEKAGTVTLTVQRVDGDVGEVTVDYTTVDGTAVAGTDYTATTQKLTFADGETTSKTFPVAIIDDAIIKADRMFTATLSNPGGGATIGTPDTESVTINEDDSTLQFEKADWSVNEAEATHVAVLTVKRIGSTAGQASIDYETTDGTAVAGVDYTVAVGTLTFEAGQASKQISIPIADDRLVTGERSFDVTLTNPVGGSLLGEPAKAMVTIVEDDSYGTIKMDQADYVVAEAGGKLIVTVTRTAKGVGAVKVDYMTADGTATEGADYTAVSGTLEFLQDETSKTVEIPIANDTLADPDETFTFTLSDTTGGVDLGDPAESTVTIVDDDLAGVVQLTATSVSVKEEAGVASLKVTRTGGLASGVMVDYATEDITAVTGTDYTGTSGTLEFGAGETEKTIDIPIAGDTLMNGNRSFVFRLSNPDGGAVLGTPVATTVTIVDNDVAGTIAFSQAGFSVAETAGKAVITVIRSGGAASGASVDYAATAETAVSPSEFTAVSGTLTFAAGETSKAFEVQVFDDLDPEEAKTVKLKLSNPLGGCKLGTQSQVMLSIESDDVAGALQFEATEAAADETSGQVVLKVVRTNGSAGTVTVAYATQNGSALAGTDYTQTSGTLTFAPEETTKEITIPILDDQVVEGTESFLVRLSSPTGRAILGGQLTSTVTIRDDDSNGKLQFDKAAYAVGEADGSAILTVVRSGGSIGAVKVKYAVTGGTAVAGADYTLAGGTLEFAAGELEKQITVAIIDDTIIEPLETIKIELSSPIGGAALGAPSATTLTIQSDDVGGILEFDKAVYEVKENLPSAEIMVLRTEGAASGISVRYATTGGSANSSTSYKAVSGILTFGAGETSKTFTVPLINDTVVNGNRTVALVLSSPSGDATLGTVKEASLVIQDDDVGGTVQFNQAEYRAVENAGVAKITIARTGGTGGGVSVGYSVVGVTATAGLDYTAVSGRVTFAAGETSKSFTIPIINDTLVEVPETVSISLSDPSPGLELGTPNPATLTIVDDDLGGAIRFNQLSYAVNESLGKVTLSVMRSGGNAGGVTVAYATEATGTAVEGDDYVAVSGTLVFKAGETTKTIVVPLVNDTLVRGSRTFTVRLSDAAGGGVLGSPSAAMVTIADNDVAGSMQFKSLAMAVKENVGVATIMVTRSGGTASGVSVDYASNEGAGTAIYDTDYTPVSGTLTFAAGETVKTFSLPILNDQVWRGSRTVKLSLSNPAGGGKIGSAATMTVTINDDEIPGVLQFAASTVSVTEASGLAVLTVNRTGGSNGRVEVGYATSNVSALAGRDYEAASGTLVFEDGEIRKTIEIPILTSKSAESAESFKVLLTAPTTGATLGSIKTATVTIAAHR
jgi:hypothetical protein